MAYRIEVERRAQKELRRLHRQARSRIEETIDGLANTPRPPGCLQVQNAPKGTYRIRVGDYRVIYLVLDEDEVVVVARVARRSESTYRGL